jgi:hypothetical protein
MSDIKINFDKSEVILIGGNNDVAVLYTDIFNCQVGLFSIKYLGVHVSASRFVVDWPKLEEKMGKKLDMW